MKDDARKDDAKGKIKHAGGKVEEEMGELLGDRKMKRHGKLSQIEGEAQQDQADAEDAAIDAAARKNAARVAKDLDR